MGVTSCQGIPATGRPVTIDMVTIDRLADGRIVAHFVSLDAMGLLQQLGAFPAKG
jgi:predicted ester cyclase